ncbi:TetR/AcrR family transcriptional regulator [Nocardioides albidus]|uniref:TetR/AcrR family transcriptional regulator n=1 Tax=Nocardioides albidus TaxID=1517589 RepID=A0A5C4VRV6_9ACTN|nr:TetR/AcrR family transcriptional regulator [Nocardioides albidus]TNM38602.1 TetR/AcrR family transcriptional regulator [Nocardioides albidus]
MLGSSNRNRIAERREATRREILDAAWRQAREVGVAGITLRDIARTVGMQPPSLYSHFDSKLAIYDAMYADSWLAYEEHVSRELDPLPTHPRDAIRLIARVFFDFSVADPARYQLMNHRTIPGFEPTAESYAPAVRVLERGVETFGALGVTDRADFDIWVSLLGGLIDQQLANDPGGDRFSRLLERATDMWADAGGIPHRTARRASTKRRARP